MRPLKYRKIAEFIRAGGVHKLGELIRSVGQNQDA